MTRESLESWLRAYGKAWEHRNAQAAADLFSEDVLYSVLPFTLPINGRHELLKYWTHVTSSQDEIRFDFEIIAAGPTEGVAHWRASFLRPIEKKRLELDGICVLVLNCEGRCTHFREWWHKRETTLASRKDGTEDS